MIYALYTALFLWVFWYLYLIVMGLYRAKLKGKLTWPVKVLGAPALIIGIIVDVVAQYTVATVFFLDLPRKGEHLVTDRLQRYSAGTGWRKAKADWICSNLLDVFDPHEDHC